MPPFTYNRPKDAEFLDKKLGVLNFIAGNTAGQQRIGEPTMTKVQTFTTELKIFHSVKELKDLDEKVNSFLNENDIKNIVSVSDACTTDNNGATIGLIRTVAYEA